MLFERKTAGIGTSASWVSSFASFLPSNPATIMTFTCLFFLGTIVYRFSPPLSPRAQLVQLKNLLDEMIDSDEMSTGGLTLPIHSPRNTQKFFKTSSWVDGLRSLKAVYMQARACCKQIQAMKPFIPIANIEARKKCLEEGEDILE
ncbi:hypothetical protein EDD85DRAFT_789965 [Armillaria nabsnona]|nr:hypothetical protein EDD85DRAFT_789965 [Armillaria nabsnona]